MKRKAHVPVQMMLEVPPIVEGLLGNSLYEGHPSVGFRKALDEDGGVHSIHCQYWHLSNTSVVLHEMSVKRAASVELHVDD